MGKIKGFDAINLILEACISSSKAPPIILHEENNKKYSLKSQINVLLTLPPAAGKSTSILRDNRNVVWTHNLSFAGIMGTITKAGEFQHGIISQCGGKCLIVDEYQNMKTDVKNGLLNLLENGYFDKTISYNLKQTVHKGNKNSLIEVIGKKNTGSFTIRARFSSIFLGALSPEIQKKNMFNINDERFKRENINKSAFLSRFIPCTKFVTVEDMYNVVRGKPLFEITDNSRKYTESVEFPDYLKFVDDHKKIFDNLPFKDFFLREQYLLGMVTRNCQNMVRISGYLTRGNSVIHRENVGILLTPLTLFMLAQNTLNFNQYTILMNLLNHHKSQKEVAFELEITQQAVSKIEEYLRKVKLLQGGEYVQNITV